MFVHTQFLEVLDGDVREELAQGYEGIWCYSYEGFDSMGVSC